MIHRFHTVCFSGYRPEKFSFPLDKNNVQFLRLQVNIKEAIYKVLELGYTHFLCGMAKGFDLLCADVLLNIQAQEKHNINLTAVLPFDGHGFSGKWGQLHKTVKDYADQIVITSPEYSSACFYFRNRYMIDNSNFLICYWDGKEGGTAHTVQLAKDSQLEILNLATLKIPSLMDSKHQ